MPREHPIRTCSPSSAAAAATRRRMALDSAGHLWIAWYSNATGATGMYVQQLDPATAAPIGSPALAPSSESSQQQQLRRGAGLRGHLPHRLRQLAGGRARRHDRLLVAGPGRSDHDREPRGHRAGRRARPHRRLSRRRAPLGRLVRRQDLPRDARRRDRRGRRGTGCRRAEGLAGRRLRADGDGRRRQPPAGRELRAGSATATSCRSRSS